MITLNSVKNLKLIVYFIIAIVHLFFIGHNEIFHEDENIWWQVVRGNNKNQITEILQILYWQFSNSPVWSICDVLLRNNIISDISFLKPVQIFMHCYSFKIFVDLFPKLRLIVGLLFLNPIVFQAFNISSPEFISFFLIALLIKFIKENKYNHLLVLISVLSIVNIKFHFLIVLFLLLIIIYILKKKAIVLHNWIIILSISMTLLIPLKNLVVHNTFGYTFFLKGNIAANYNINDEKTDINFFYKSFDSTKYADVTNIYISPVHNKFNSYEYRDYLNGVSINYLLEKIRSNGLQYFGFIFRTNVYTFFKSPNDYDIFFSKHYDWLDLIWLKFKPLSITYPLHQSYINIPSGYYLSLYHLVYPLLIIAILYLVIKQKEFGILFVLLSVVFYFLALTSLIDGEESNRMRMGIEPIFYYFLLHVLTIFRPSFKKEAKG